MKKTYARIQPYSLTEIQRSILHEFSTEKVLFILQTL